MPTLSEDQRRAAEAPERSTLILSGPPGSGKTTVMVERARRLCTSGSVLIVAFNRTLAEQYEQRLQAEASAGKEAIEVVLAHRLFRRLATLAPPLQFSPDNLCPDSDWLVTFVDMARDLLGASVPDLLAESLLDLVASAIAGDPEPLARSMGCDVATAGLLLERAERRMQHDGAVPFGLLPHYAARALLSVEGPRWDHVLIDEIHDMDLTGLQIIAGRAKSSLTLSVAPDALGPESRSELLAWLTDDSAHELPVNRITLGQRHAANSSLSAGEPERLLSLTLDEIFADEGGRQVAVVTFSAQDRGTIVRWVDAWIERSRPLGAADEIEVLVLDATQGREFDEVILLLIEPRPFVLRDPQRRCYVAVTRGRGPLRVLVDQAHERAWSPLFPLLGIRESR